MLIISSSFWNYGTKCGGSSNRKPVSKHGKKAEERKAEKGTLKNRQRSGKRCFKWEAFSGSLASVRTREQQSAHGKAVGNFGCSVFGKMQPFPLPAVSTAIPVGCLFRVEVQQQKQQVIHSFSGCSETKKVL